MKKSRLLGAVCACITFISTSVSAATINDFTGGYDVSNWTQSLDGGSINTAGAPNSIVLTSANGSPTDGRGPATNTTFTIAALGDGLVSFDWDYSTTDSLGPTFDPFGYLLNGAFTQLTNDGGANAQSGSTAFAVLAGDVFGFDQQATDSCCGPGVTTISGFSAPSAIPVPAAVWLFGSGLLGLVGIARRKKA